jgi:hypothetical protein
MPDTNYEHDFFAWANEQAALLRTGKLAQADIAHIAEEIESMGKTEKRELVSRLRVLMLRLLKWQFQPLGRTASWEASIGVQRLDLAEHLKDNPSLKPYAPEAIETAFKGALLETAAETKLPKSTFPPVCPYSLEQMMDAQFWPD